MEARSTIQTAIGQKASGLVKFGSFFEFIGWLDVVGGIITGFVIGSQDKTTFTVSFLGKLEPKTEKDWATGITVGVALAVSGLMLVAIARALSLFALHAAAQNGLDMVDLVPPVPSSTADAGWGGVTGTLAEDAHRASGDEGGSFGR